MQEKFLGYEEDDMVLKPRFWGSTAALAIGCLSIVAGLANLSFSNLIAGTVSVIGSLIYRSAKKTKLGLVTSSVTRKLTEGIGVALIIGIVGLQRDLLELVYYDPVPNLFIPVFALLAYGIAKTSSPQFASSTD